MTTGCTHLDQVADVEPSSEGCEDCLRIGGRWVHLRMCMSCGHVGCCDNSPNRHATAHFAAAPPSDHPVVRTGRGLVVLLRRRRRLHGRRRTVVRPPMSKGPAIAACVAGSAVMIGGPASLGARLGDGLSCRGRSHPLPPWWGHDLHRVGGAREFRRRREPRSSFDRRPAQRLRPPLPGDRGNDRRSVRDRQRVDLHARRARRQPRVPGRGHARSRGYDAAGRRRRRGSAGTRDPLRLGRRSRPPPPSSRRRPVTPPAHLHAHPSNDGGHHHGPALRLPRHPADHR